MKAKNKLWALLVTSGAVCIGAIAVAATAATATGIRTFYNKDNGHRYEYVPGNLTRDQAWAVARARGGYPVVFSSMAEHAAVVNALRYWEIAPAHTGHYQDPAGREPGMNWRTYTGERSARLRNLFNSDGPDDGVRNKWGWESTDEGTTIYYGPSEGKNEDAGVIWHDNGGKLEDVSVNHRGGVVVEYDR